ncbi:MAG: asparagine synthase (glutamine-hydrolyzing) [Asgard group archaeon]|nr:asparagine synthase (glutamine-hydrolyzing) [Asgard group archaeon]
MCSIVGLNWNDSALIKKMSNVLKHRGPDYQDTFSDNFVTFAHNRLSIIDLSAKANQPMLYQHKNKSALIIYNGEIFNFLELRQILLEKGYRFDTNSDTEVILAMYLEYGSECVKYFNGQWSFCIYNMNEKLLFCSRDRYGQKPFYYYFKDEKFIFSSEIKAIIQFSELEINKHENILTKSIDFYLDLGFIPSPFTIYKNISKLKLGENMIFDLQENKIKKKWIFYDLPEYDPEKKLSVLKKEMLELITDSVEKRLISDVPVGAFLSGGLDSSFIVAMMQNFVTLSDLHTFSIGFDGKFDESKYIDIVKDYFGTKHHHYMFKEKDFRNLITKYSYHYDEPFCDPAGFPTFVISEMAKKHVKVVLSGDGGDEVFGGSSNLHKGRRLDIIQKFPKFFKKTILTLTGFKKLTKNPVVSLMRDAVKLTMRKEHEFPLEKLDLYKDASDTYRTWFKGNVENSLKLAKDKFSEAFRINDILYNTFGDNFLVKVDRASMSSSIEVRSPFLDYRIIELSMKIPYKWKHGLYKNKLLMRKLIRNQLPKVIVNRGKQGFTPPLSEWIDKDYYIELLEQQVNLLQSIDSISLKHHISKINEETNTKRMLIRIFLLAQWYKQWINP